MNAGHNTTDLANRMAGWFFVVFGAFVLLFAGAVRSVYLPEPDTPLFVWLLAAVGIASVAFGVFAPRSLRASVLDAFVTFVWL